MPESHAQDVAKYGTFQACLQHGKACMHQRCHETAAKDPDRVHAALDFLVLAVGPLDP